MAVRVAKRYHQHHLKFCIITFYDSQRSAITKALDAEKIPSGCVYNVDSFQGTFHSSHIRLPQLDIPATTFITRKRGRLRDTVFGQNTESRIFGVTPAYECRLDSLPEGIDSRNQQNLSTKIREVHASREAM
jgi:hypothetical protein